MRPMTFCADRTDSLDPKLPDDLAADGADRAAVEPDRELRLSVDRRQEPVLRQNWVRLARGTSLLVRQAKDDGNWYEAPESPRPPDVDVASREEDSRGHGGWP